MTDDRTAFPEDDTLAAEYVLGLLSGEELRAARERASSDAAFAEEIARWRGRLGSLNAEIEQVAPPAGLWARIEKALRPPAAANDDLRDLRRSVRLWRSGFGAMTALVAALALVLVLQPASRTGPAPLPGPSAAPPMVAMLGDGGAMKVVASWDPDARQLVLAVAGDMADTPGKSYELWVIPSGGQPRSLGTMPSGKRMHMRLAETIAGLLRQGATIAISVEPRGGSPTGAPTGPVVASGALSQA